MSLILFILIVPALFTIPIAFCWKQFEKAGQKGWYSLIPYYNIFVMLKIIGKQKKFWWWFFIVFPYINIFMLLLMLVELGKCFGRFNVWEEGMAALLPYIFFPIIAKDDKYQDPLTTKRPKKSTARMVRRHHLRRGRRPDYPNLRLRDVHHPHIEHGEVALRG